MTHGKTSKNPEHPAAKGIKSTLIKVSKAVLAHAAQRCPWLDTEVALLCLGRSWQLVATWLDTDGHWFLLRKMSKVFASGRIFST